ncbi:MAG: ABC transporter permease [Vicinamibacteria bacterium]|nr:ABC transporter permease [Vicinamibacteria bacterium]
MQGWLGDGRQAWRSLRRQRGLALAATLTLGLGIGANTALFSLVDAVLLRPLPFPQPDRLVALWETTPDRWRVAPGTYLDWQREARGFAAIGAYAAAAATLTGHDEAERVDGVAASASYFEVLGVAPVLGRTIEAADEAAGAPRVVVLGHGLWQRRFGGEPGVLGAVVALDGAPTTVVGVMPPGLYPSWPTAGGRFTTRERSAEFFTPITIESSFADNRRSHVLGVIGRLEPGADREAVQAGLGALASTLADRHPETAGEGVLLTALEDEIVGDVRGALFALLGAVGCVLLLACANVAGLLLARSAARGRELAIRRALGADRSRIVRLLLAESLLLATAGGACGVTLAQLGLPPLLALLPQELPRVDAVGVDARVLAFALGLSVATTLLFGLGPALAAASGDPLPRLRDGAAAGGGAGRRRARTLLVTGQVALALSLLTAGGLLLRSFDALRRVDPGFAARGVLAFDLALAPDYASAEQVRDAWGELLRRFETLPGVEHAAIAYDTPLESNWIDGFGIEGQPSPAEGLSARLAIVSPGYFDALGIAVVRGRPLSPADQANAPGAVVVTESFARRFFPGVDPLGRWLRIGTPAATWGEAAPPRFQVVGVARDVRSTGLAGPPEPTYHLAAAQFPQREMTVLLRTRGEPLHSLSAARAEVAAFDPTLAPTSASTLQQALASQVAQPRFNGLVLAGFAGLALLLAAVGLHGLLSHAVEQRRRELGVRLALGARPAQIAGLVIGDGLRLVAVGAGLGLAGSALVGEALRTVLFGVGAHDAVAYGLGAAALFAAAFAAAAGPALRASGVPAAEALRAE